MKWSSIPRIWLFFGWLSLFFINPLTQAQNAKPTHDFLTWCQPFQLQRFMQEKPLLLNLNRLPITQAIPAYLLDPFRDPQTGQTYCLPVFILTYVLWVNENQAQELRPFVEDIDIFTTTLEQKDLHLGFVGKPTLWSGFSPNLGGKDLGYLQWQANKQNYAQRFRQKWQTFLSKTQTRFHAYATYAQAKKALLDDKIDFLLAPLHSAWTDSLTPLAIPRHPSQDHCALLHFPAVGIGIKANQVALDAHVVQQSMKDFYTQLHKQLHLLRHYFWQCQVNVLYKDFNDSFDIWINAPLSQDIYAIEPFLPPVLQQRQAQQPGVSDAEHTATSLQTESVISTPNAVEQIMPRDTDQATFSLQPNQKEQTQQDTRILKKTKNPDLEAQSPATANDVIRQLRHPDAELHQRDKPIVREKSAKKPDEMLHLIEALDAVSPAPVDIEQKEPLEKDLSSEQEMRSQPDEEDAPNPLEHKDATFA